MARHGLQPSTQNIGKKISFFSIHLCIGGRTPHVICDKSSAPQITKSHKHEVAQS